MAQQARVPDNIRPVGIGSGPYLAKVVSHLDPTYMGGLEVTLLRRQGNTIGDEGQTYIVRYASPFFGSTAFEFMGTNKADFNDTQKSYGMWFVPPDIGTTVIVIFVDANPGDGYWIACVPSRYANHMVPGLAASENFEITKEQKELYGNLERFPVGETNRRANDLTQQGNVDRVKKPIHPITDKLLQQGLLQDDVRGTHNSSSRREAPSMVFGISTPGPLDKREGAKRAVVGKRLSQTQAPVPVSRLGGTQIVMDDGDDQYVRLTDASTGPVEYIDTLDPNERRRGKVEIPYGESFRIRTRTGHQFLMHNAEDLIYITNSRGTAWFEMSSDGKIDVYAEDSVSIHTKNDFNFFADRDFNLEARRHVNIKAGGRLNGDFGAQIHMRAGLDMKLSVAESLDLKVGTNTIFNTGAKLEIGAGEATKLSTATTLDIFSGTDLKITSGANTDFLTASAVRFGSASLDLGSSGAIIIKGATVDINGPDAAPATAAEPASEATEAPPLSVHEVPLTTPFNWATTRYQSGTMSTIMLRVPMHEPWPLHENQAPAQLKPSFTDRDSGGFIAPQYVPTTQASEITQTAAHVDEVNDFASNTVDPATVTPGGPPPTPSPTATAVAPTIGAGNNIPEDYFLPSRYSRRTAERLNTLDASCKLVFARAIKAFIDAYHSQGWDCSVSECLRSFARSQELYEAYKAGRGPQAASAGNSWHNYGAAADLLFYKDGNWDSMNRTGVYTGFGRDVMRQNGLHNNAGANDCGHFVPIQMTRGVPRSVKSGEITIAQIMSGERTIS